MSYSNPQPCKNQCGAWIYFDKDSAAGHPSADKWLPLGYNHDSGIKTGLIHQCPKRSDAFKFTKSVNLPTGSTPESQQKSSLERVTEESVQKGITALKMFSDLAIEVEGIGVETGLFEDEFADATNKSGLNFLLVEYLSPYMPGIIKLQQWE
jgi:hypothetical protein